MYLFVKWKKQQIKKVDPHHIGSLDVSNFEYVLLFSTRKRTKNQNKYLIF